MQTRTIWSEIIIGMGLLVASEAGAEAILLDVSFTPVPEPVSSTLGVAAAGFIWVAFTRRSASVTSFPSNRRLL